MAILEQKVEQLETLPARMAAIELQVLQMRDEIRLEFSAVRQEIREGDQETRRFMRVLHEDVIARIAALAEARR